MLTAKGLPVDQQDQVMIVSPDVFSEIHRKSVELYDFICVDHDIAFRGWLREKFGIESGMSIRVVIDYTLPENSWGFTAANPPHSPQTHHSSPASG